MATRHIDGTRRVIYLRYGRAAALTAVLLLAAWLTAPAEAQRREDPLAGLTSSQRRIFQNYTRLYCQQFFRFEENRFVLLPNHQRARENSAGRTYDQAEEEMTVVKREARRTALGRKMVDVKYPPPAAEVIVSARVIPAIDVGHYGFVNSVMVQDVIGPSEMIVTRIELIPPSEVGTGNNTLRKAAAERQKEYATKSYRLLGFNTKDIKPGDKYFGPRKKGLQIAVMSTDPQHTFALVNYDELKRVRTNEFAEALGYVKIEPLAFIDMVRKNREELSTKGDKASLIYIYRRFYNRYRPKRLSSTTQPEITTPDPSPEPKPEPEVIEPEPKPQTGPKYGPLEREDPKPEPEPEPQPRPAPEPEDDEEEDDWDVEEDTQDKSDSPTFFGIPL